MLISKHMFSLDVWILFKHFGTQFTIIILYFTSDVRPLTDVHVRYSTDCTDCAENWHNQRRATPAAHAACVEGWLRHTILDFLLEIRWSGPFWDSGIFHGI